MKLKPVEHFQTNEVPKWTKAISLLIGSSSKDNNGKYVYISESCLWDRKPGYKMDEMLKSMFHDIPNKELECCGYITVKSLFLSANDMYMRTEEFPHTTAFENYLVYPDKWNKLLYDEYEKFLGDREEDKKNDDDNNDNDDNDKDEDMKQIEKEVSVTMKKSSKMKEHCIIAMNKFFYAISEVKARQEEQKEMKTNNFFLDQQRMQPHRYYDFSELEDDFKKKLIPNTILLCSSTSVESQLVSRIFCNLFNRTETECNEYSPYRVPPYDQSEMKNQQEQKPKEQKPKEQPQQQTGMDIDTLYID